MNYFKINKKAFGSVASTLIMFIAVVGVSIGMVVTFQDYVLKTQHAMGVQNDAISNKLKSSISITNIYYNSSSNKTYTYVKNIGSIKLTPSKFDLFIDDKYTHNFSAVYANNLSKNVILFNPQETIAIIYPTGLVAGTHKVKVVTEYSSYSEDSFNT